MRLSKMYAALFVVPFLSCSDAGVTEQPPLVAAVEVLPANGAVVRNGILELTAVPRDVEGRPLYGREVTWSIPGDGTLAFIEDKRQVVGLGLGGPITIQAQADGRTGTATVSVITTGSDALDRVLSQTGTLVRMMREYNRALLGPNPAFEAAIRRKIEMLQRPELSSEIVRGRYLDRTLASLDRSLPLVGIYPADSMKAGTEAVLDELQRLVPLLESFMRARVPAPNVQVWYGFSLGSSGGGGTLNIEDIGTYHARNTPLPHGAIIAHELSHSYIGHEWLTQVLELYLYNVSRGESERVDDWTFTRGYIPELDTNKGLHAALDVYRLLGPAMMADVFHALHAMYPPYGQPLSDAARQAIIDRAPAALRELVARKVAAIDA